MYTIQLVIIAIIIGIDGFTIAAARSTNFKLTNFQKIITGVSFGAFHALMPLLGWFAGENVSKIVSVDGPFIAFILIFIVAVGMLYDGIKNKEIEHEEIFSYKKLILLSIAASIDAFALGVSFSFMKIDIILALVIIGLVVFLMTENGILLGDKLEDLFGNKIKIIGAIALILIAINFLIEGLRAII